MMRRAICWPWPHNVFIALPHFGMCQTIVRRDALKNVRVLKDSCSYCEILMARLHFVHVMLNVNLFAEARVTIRRFSRETPVCEHRSDCDDFCIVIFSLTLCCFLGSLPPFWSVLQTMMPPLTTSTVRKTIHAQRSTILCCPCWRK